MQKNASVGFSSNGRSHHIAECKCWVTFSFAFPHRCQRICGFATLRNCKYESSIIDRRIAISLFTRVFYFREHPSKFFEKVFADESCVPAGSAGCENNSVGSAQLLSGQIQPADHCGAFAFVETTSKRIFDCLRLLEDFLKHVVLVVAQFDIRRHLFQCLDRGAHVSGRAMFNVQFARLQDGHFVVRERDNFSCVSKQRAGVAGQEVLILADTNNQRTSALAAMMVSGQLRNMTPNPYVPCRRSSVIFTALRYVWTSSDGYPQA